MITLNKDRAQMCSDDLVHIDMDDGSYSYTLRYSIGGKTGTIRENWTVGHFYWQVPDLAWCIPGKTEGICTITCVYKRAGAVVKTETAALTLVVPEASQVEAIAGAAVVKMGNITSFRTNRRSSGFTHTLTYSMGGATGTIATGVTDAAEWLVPKELASYTGGQVEATCTVTCETYNGTALVGKTTDQLTLRVPDATVPALSAGEAELGKKITIFMAAEAEAFVHDLTYELRYVGEEKVLATGKIAGDCKTEYEWELPYALAALFPEKVHAAVTVICSTLVGEDVVGAAQVGFTVTVPENEITKPNLDVRLDLGGEPFPGLAVVSKDLTVTKTVSSEYSKINFFGYSFGENEDGLMIGTKVYTKTYSTAGEQVIVESVTDERGYTAEVRIPVTVIDYAKPRIVPHTDENNIVCVRCDAAGNVTPSGTSLLIRMGRKYSKVLSGGEQHNYCKLSYRWKTSSEAAFSEPVELLAEGAQTDEVAVVLHEGLLRISAVYHIQLIAEDTAGNTDTFTVTVPSSFTTAHSPVGGHGFSLGRYCDPKKVDMFDCAFAAEFEKEVTFFGNVTGMVLGLGKLPQIPDGADVNEYTVPGVYGVHDDNNAGMIHNLPVAADGVFRVWSGNGLAHMENGYVAMQEFITDDNSATYRRSLKYSTVSGGTWTIGPWKTHAWQEI